MTYQIKKYAPAAVCVPVWPVGEDGACTCPLKSRCKRPAKHPDPKAPGSAYAIYSELGGERSGLLVVDVDCKKGAKGYEQFDAILARAGFQEGEYPDTLSVKTPSGGVHFYFVHPDVCVGDAKLAKDIDIRADGESYIMGPGSPGYKIDWDAPIAECPDWLLAELVARGTKETKGEWPVEPYTDDADRYAKVLAAYHTWLADAPLSQGDGEASSTLLYVVKEGIRARQLTRDDVLAAILELWNPRCCNVEGKPWPWSEEEICRAIVSSAEDGVSMPGTKVLPPGALVDALKRNPYAPVYIPSIINEDGTTYERQKAGAGDTYSGKREKPTAADISKMLYDHPDWLGVLNYDVLKRRPFAVDPPISGAMTLEYGRLSRGDIAQIRLWFDLHGYAVGRDAIEDGLWSAIRQPDRQTNAIARYLDALPKASRTNAIDTLATDFLGARDDFANILVKKTLVAAVRRARSPGHHHRLMLVLKGDQGCGKTEFCKILAGDWYHTTGSGGDLSDRDTKLECVGSWIVEVEELSAMNRADTNALKAAVSATHDTITKKYEPDADVFPRSFVFIGTTNKDAFLTDETGNTRYGIIECTGKLDRNRLIAIRDQIWTEAVWLAENTPLDSNALTGDELAKLEMCNEGFVESDPWDDAAEKFLAGKTEVTATGFLAHVFKGELARYEQKDLTRANKIFSRLGCRRVTPKDKDRKTYKAFKVPDTYTTRPGPLAAVLPIKSPK